MFARRIMIARGLLFGFAYTSSMRFRRGVEPGYLAKLR